MTTHIFNEHNVCISEGRNLAIIFAYARKTGGVSKIHISKLDSSRYEALVNVHFVNGYRACTNFVSFAHALDWANDKSKRKNTYWTGCQVQTYEMTFEYYINLDERGSFYADVRNEQGNTVFEIHSDDEENGAIWLIDAGYMRHTEDLQGLADYLIQAGIMRKDDKLVKGQ
jgi:hypothetical protein